MKNYLVTWKIDIENVETPLEAAEKAWEIVREKGTTANVLNVREKLAGGGLGKEQEIDLETEKEDFWHYTPELSDTIYTKKDFLEIAKGNNDYAIRLRYAVEWQHPETIVDEDLREGEIIEKNGTYIMVN
jgi:GTP cyclohydrolase III